MQTMPKGIARSVIVSSRFERFETALPATIKNIIQMTGIDNRDIGILMLPLARIPPNTIESFVLNHKLIHRYSLQPMQDFQP